MKNKSFAIVPITLLGIFCGLAISVHKGYVRASNEVDLAATPSLSVLRLGELLTLDIKLTNNTQKPKYFWKPYVKIAFKESGDFKLYAPAGPAISLDGINMPSKLDPQATMGTPRTILWNSKPSVGHLNPDAAKPELEGRILSDYAFPETGTYFVKVYVMIFDDESGSGTGKMVESDPIKITITAPKGEDLEVWNKIKDNGEFAYFMQEGDITRGYKKPENRTKFQQELQDILNKYPNSFYSQSLRQSLDKFRVGEAKRQEIRDKLLKQKPQ